MTLDARNRITYIRLLASTRDRLRSTFPDLPYPAIVDTLLDYYERHEGVKE